ncbi:MAG: ParB/RepB/Spo0J family partition protein [Oligoflexia bacterium]|nr:ParB/RepB/Spo0J family partition protein [Oligoflexia bacterium]
MVKNFAPRKSKKERAIINITNSVTRDVIKSSEQKLLRGAQLSEIKLSEITVRDQVRTKFNDNSLKELAENIRLNGLIQPLVIHREGNKFILLCGERRYRAMKLIAKESAPCFVIEGKTKEELLAIQFSENSAREELHYVDKADGIYNYYLATGSSERKIEQELGISKTEVHRSIQIAKLSRELKEAAKVHNIEKYVLLEYEVLDDGFARKSEVKNAILAGEVTKRAQFKKIVNNLVVNHRADKENLMKKF